MEEDQEESPPEQHTNATNVKVKMRHQEDMKQQLISKVREEEKGERSREIVCSH